VFKPQARFVFILAVLVLLGGCPADNGFTESQQGVYKAMRKWTQACEARDTSVMWAMLSPDAQRFYSLELKEHVIPTVRMNKATLAPGSLISDQRRKEVEEHLKTLPENPDDMSAEDYYAWRVKKDLTPGNIENQIRLFSRENVENIVIDVDRATVELKHGEPSKYSWRRDDGVWKFDVMPSMLRALGAENPASK
jgi:hypothetical protein